MNPIRRPPNILTAPDPAGLAEEAARRCVALAAEAIGARGRFTLALAGGSTPAELYRLLSQTPFHEKIDWSRTLIFFGDERCVPPDHPWSNYRMAREALLEHVPLPPANVYRMAGELAPVDAAAGYAQALRRAFGLRGAARPRFDLILLGMGDDGHTASLFPGATALTERRRLVVAVNPPGYVQPAVSRITLTLPVLNAARQVMFLVAGAGKAEKVRAVLGDIQAGDLEDISDQESYLSYAERVDNSKPTATRDRQNVSQDFPAGQVQPAHGTLIWLLDHAATGQL